MARGRRGRPISTRALHDAGRGSETRCRIRSCVVPVHVETTERASRSRSRRSHSRSRSRLVELRAARRVQVCLLDAYVAVHVERVILVAAPNHMKALEAKSQEVEDVKEQLNTLKRKASETEPEFKYKSNKKQFKFNLEVKKKFSQTVERAGADDALKKIANAGMSLIDSRNKLISIADRDGWDAVEFFEADPLTKNDDEEKSFGGGEISR